jgi:hypothetical protein
MLFDDKGIPSAGMPVPMTAVRRRRLRRRDVLLAVAYTVLLTLLVAPASVNPDLPVAPALYVAVVYGFAVAGGIAVGVVIGRSWALGLPGAMVILTIPILVLIAVLEDPPPDGQGGLAMFVIAVVATAAIGAGLGASQALGSTSHRRNLKLSDSERRSGRHERP